MKEWQRRLRICRESGKPVAIWCEENGFNIKTYYHWKKLIDRELGEDEESGNVSEPVETESKPVETELKIKVHYGKIVIDLPIEMPICQIAELIKALR